MTYSTAEIERIAHVGFKAARWGRQKRLCSVDKANILACSQLWREVVTAVGREYPHVALSHLYVDNCAMQLIRNPSQFDVIVTENTFGDILRFHRRSLDAGGLDGYAALGMPGRRQPHRLLRAHPRLRPYIVGQGIANPLAAILTAAMMLRHSFSLGRRGHPPSTRPWRPCSKARATCTADIMEAGAQRLSTAEMGERVAEHLERIET